MDPWCGEGRSHLPPAQRSFQVQSDRRVEENLGKRRAAEISAPEPSSFRRSLPWPLGSCPDAGLFLRIALAILGAPRRAHDSVLSKVYI